MLNDIHGGNPRGMAFKDYLQSQRRTIPIKGFEVRVLTTGFWPLYPMMKINVPTEMQECMTAFTDHYMSHTNHRTLNWVHRLGFATVRGNFKKWYDLQVTTLQAMVMLQFNSGKDVRAMFGGDDTVVAAIAFGKKLVPIIFHDKDMLST